MIFRIATVMSSDLMPSVVDHEKLASLLNSRASEHLGSVLQLMLNKEGSTLPDKMFAQELPEHIAKQVAHLVNHDLQTMLTGLTEDWGAIDMHASCEFEDSSTLMITISPKWYHLGSNEMH